MALKFSVHMGYTQSVDFKNQQVSLVLSAVSWDHNYCRIFTKQTECPSRLGILEFQGSLRLETPSKYVQKHNQTFWISNRGPMQQYWNKMFPYAFPPFSLISRILKKVCQEKVEQMIIITPTWQTQPWYPLLLEISM